MKFAAGVTLYNPTQEQLSRISDLQSSFDMIFLFDNSEPDYIKPEYPEGEKIVLQSEGFNKGLPFAFNSIISRCDDYDFLCTLDQDSSFLHGDIVSICNYIEKSVNIDDTGIVAPFIDYGYNVQKVDSIVEQKRWVITSGAFVNLHIVKKERLKYDDNYFIDKFEIDLCWQLTTRGYKILMYHPSVLHQQLGEKKGKSRSSHNALRHYYLFRNRFYFNNKWYKGPKKWFLNVAQTTRHLLMVIRYEDEPAKKLKSFAEATKDYLAGRMGKKDYFLK